MRWISAISVLFFSYAALMQIEGDPDTIKWVVIYASIAIGSFTNFFFRPGKKFIGVPLVIAAVALVWGLLLVPKFDLIVEGHVLNIFEKVEQGEEEREAFGLLLVFLFAVFEVYHSYARASSDDE